MEINVRHAPSFAVARAVLAGGETIKAESGAMMATSDGVSLEAKMTGGLMKSLRRSVLGGESLFVTTYTAPSEGGWVDVAAHLPGDVVVRDVQAERGLFVSRGSWLCSEETVDLDTKWGGFKNMFGGEGGFLVRATGQGHVVLSCYGALDVITLAAGERLVLDSGHMVAYDEGVTFNLRRASQGRTIQSIKSGEGWVFEFTGPGDVMTQTRNPDALIGWLTNTLPFSRS
jgi:uncharacterized protein (TIGR00266 family)